MFKKRTLFDSPLFFCGQFVLLILLAAVLLLWHFSASAAILTEETAFCFQQTGQPARGRAAVPVTEQAVPKSASLGELGSEDSCLILGETDGYYRILWNRQIGYVPKKQMEMTAEIAPEAFPETICDDVSLLTPLPDRLDTFLVLQGEVTSEKPLDALLFYLWDQRQFQVERAYMVTLPEPSFSVSMADFSRVFPLKDLEGGRKSLVIEGVSGAEIFVLWRSPVYIRGKSRELPNVNHLTEGLPVQVRDNDVKTAWRPKAKSPSFEFTVTPEARAVIMTLEWLTPPESCLVETWAADGTPLSRETLTNGFYADCLDLDPAAWRIRITPAGKQAALSTVRLCAEPWSRHAIQRWQPVPENLDLLVISTHQDDEFLFFGGAIPCYAAQEDISMAVLYMVDCGRNRYREALDALWTAGLRNHPLFFGLKDSSSLDIRDARVLWNRYDPLGLLVRTLRQYRPKVVLVQDFQGEYGNGEHQLTAELTAEAVRLAALETEYPESAEAFGLWQVQKLYVHLYEENQIRMDWNQPLEETGVITPMFLAREAFDRHHSQTVLFSMDYHGGRFDNTLFGLYYSAVGEDVLKNDFLENVR